MEDLKDLYESFETELVSKRGRGIKAEKIRTFVINASQYMGKTRLAVWALYKLADLKIPRESSDKPLDKTYFKTVLEKNWIVEADENKVLWVLIDRPKGE